MTPRKNRTPKRTGRHAAPKRLTQSLGVLLAAAFAAAGLGGIVATTDNPADPAPTASADVSRETSAPTTEPIEELTPEATPSVAPEDQVSLPPVVEGVPVTRVVDGDTIRVMTDGQEVQVRMIGLDTPETVHPREPVQCYGPEASAEAKRLLEDATVVLTPDPTQDQVDHYGRALAYVEVDGVDFAEHMIREGFAREYTYKFAYQRADTYREAEDQAQAEGRGLWSADTCDGQV